MKKLFLWSGWVAAFLLCVVAGMIYLWGSQQAEQAKKLGIERSSQETVLNDLKKKVAAQIAPVTQAKPAQDVNVPSPSVVTTPASPAPTVPVSAPVKVPISPVPTPMFIPAPAPEPESATAAQGATDPVSPISPTNQTPLTGAPSAGTPAMDLPAVSPQVVSPQIAMPTATKESQALVNKYYGAFFTMVRLPQNIEHQVRGVLQRYLEARETLTQRLVQNELPLEEYANRIVSVRNQVRGDLGNILNHADMAAWNEYEMTLPERLMRQEVENALVTGVTTLSLAARTHIADVLVQEMAPIFEAQRNGFLPLALGRGMADRPITEACTRARIRLEKDFSKEEMNQAGLFIDKLLYKMTSAQ